MIEDEVWLRKGFEFLALAEERLVIGSLDS